MRKYFISNANASYGPRIFILADPDLHPTYIAARDMLDRMSAWGGADKEWDEINFTAIGWEFSDHFSFTEAQGLLGDLGYTQVEKLEELSEPAVEDIYFSQGCGI
jgi:hypothetical protein